MKLQTISTSIAWIGAENRRLIPALFLLALVPRLALVAALDPKSTEFSDQLYIDYARNFAEGRGFWAEGSYGPVGPERVYAFRPPLFPFLWGLVYKATGGSYTPIRIAHAFLSAGMCLLVFPIGVLLFGRREPAALGAAIVALYPPLIWHGVHLMTEPLFIFFQTLCILLLLLAAKNSLWWAAGAGIAGGMAALSRSAICGFLPLAGLWLFWMVRSKRNFSPETANNSQHPPAQGDFKHEGGPPNKKAVRLKPVFFCGLFWLFVAFSMLPWITRNAFVLGRFVPTTTDAGHGFYVANNDRALDDPRGFYMPEKWDFVLTEGERKLDEVTISHRLMRLGLRFCLRHPGKWALLILRRIWWLWRFYPHADQIKDYASTEHVMIYAISYVPLFPFIVGGVLVAHWGNPERRRSYWLIYLLVIYTTAIHAIFLATIRYREPLMPLLLSFAGYAFWRAWVRRMRHGLRNISSLTPPERGV